MQKRRKTTLPITTADIGSTNNTAGPERRWNKVAHRKNRSYDTSQSVLLLVAFALITLLFLRTATYHRTKYQQEHRKNLDTEAYRYYFKDSEKHQDKQKRPLHTFTSLNYALGHSELVALYFAASWCSMSTPVTDSLERAFPSVGALEKRILQPLSENTAVDGSGGLENTLNNERASLAIVYVSSDESEEDMNRYSHTNWINIPFHSTERTDLKRHFKTCAKRELQALNMERKYEIPSLIIIDSLTHGTLTTHGQDDLKELGEGALNQWLHLRDTVRALEDKYE